MVDILAQKTHTVQHTGTAGRDCARTRLLDFVTGLCDRVADAVTPKDDLYAAYVRWAKANGTSCVLGPNQFTGEMRAAAFLFPVRQRVNGQAATVFMGVALRPGLV